MARRPVRRRGPGHGDFKTPALREVARTAPECTRQPRTLEDVIEYYDRGGNRNSGLDPETRPLHLLPADKRDIIAFLRCLNGKT